MQGHVEIRTHILVFHQNNWPEPYPAYVIVFPTNAPYGIRCMNSTNIWVWIPRTIWNAPFNFPMFFLPGANCLPECMFPFENIFYLQFGEERKSISLINTFFFEKIEFLLRNFSILCKVRNVADFNTSVVFHVYILCHLWIYSVISKIRWLL